MRMSDVPCKPFINYDSESAFGCKDAVDHGGKLQFADPPPPTPPPGGLDDPQIPAVWWKNPLLWAGAAAAYVWLINKSMK